MYERAGLCVGCVAMPGRGGPHYRHIYEHERAVPWRVCVYCSGTDTVAALDGATTGLHAWFGQVLQRGFTSASIASRPHGGTCLLLSIHTRAHLHLHTIHTRTSLHLHTAHTSTNLHLHAAHAYIHASRHQPSHIWTSSLLSAPSVRTAGRTDGHDASAGGV